MLTRDAILGIADLKSEDVDVPEWGGSVRVRTMTGAERDAFGASLRNADGKVDPANYRAKLLIRCVVGDDGRPLFTDADLDALAGKSAPALDRLVAAAERLNTMGAAAVDTAEKN